MLPNKATFNEKPTTVSKDLLGKRALVTGASRGIGRAIALELARRGASVAVNFLNSKEQAISVANSISQLHSSDEAEVMLIKADISRQDDVFAMVEQVESNLGGLDIVVSNAAAGGFRDLAELTPVNFEAVIANNAAPVIWLSQAASKALSSSSGHGKLVAVSSHGSQWAVPHYGAIGASKAALESLIRHLALEYGDQGINFNCVLPGVIATDAVASMPGVEGVIQAASDRMMVGDRMLQPEDVASVVAFLSSPDSDLIQGQTIVVDGGVSIRV